MAVSMSFTVILTVIVIGSTAAYDVFLSLSVSGLLSSYVICIACTLELYTMQSSH